MQIVTPHEVRITIEKINIEKMKSDRIQIISKGSANITN